MKILAQLVSPALAGLVALCLVGCVTVSNPNSSVTKADFGRMPDGTPVEIYTLRNSKGMEATIITYGGIVTTLKVPDRNGKFGDVVLGYDDLGDYLTNSPYFGALIGRYGNRIAKGRFTLDGQTYTLAVNNAPNTLHGGLKGFDKVVWKVKEAKVGEHGPKLELTYLSKNGEENFPGNLSVTATYTVTEDNALRLDFAATTDADTVCNLTHHSYFNLRGGGDVLDYLLYVNADKFTPTDGTLIPTGELRPVAGTPLDFSAPTIIGARINNADEQIKFGNGYDHNFVLNKKPGKLSLAARVYEPESGRVMEMFTTEPGVQFYTANFLGGTGKYGWAYKPRQALCLEAQHFPDSPNHPAFPTTELKPGETYHNTIIYKFSAE
jgi:aldose 1-epimerase